MNKLNKGTMISKTAAFLIGVTISLMATIQTVFAYSITGQRLYVNGTQVDKVEIYKDGSFTFIPGEDIAKAMGDDIEGSTRYKLVIKHDGKEYEFQNGSNTYTVDGDVESFSGDETSDAKTKTINGKLYVPMEVLKSKLGYKINNDDYNVWIGEKPNNLPQTKDHSVDPIQPLSYLDYKPYLTANMLLSINDGWVCPQLKSISTEDLEQDAKILINELEFQQNGSTSATFDPLNGLAPFVTTAIGTPTPELEYCSIIFKGYTTKANDGYMQKINQINPQVLKFYFPSSWKWIHDKFISGDGLVGQRYTIDGRDVYFTAGSISETIHFSKVGGTLGGSVNGSLPSSSGTIGTTTISNGQWEQSGGSWYFKKNDGTYAKRWLKDKGNWYYLDNNGTMKTGWIQDNGKWYYCWSNGQMAANTTVGGYRLNENGVWIS